MSDRKNVLYAKRSLVPLILINTVTMTLLLQLRTLYPLQEAAYTSDPFLSDRKKRIHLFDDVEMSPLEFYIITFVSRRCVLSMVVP
jgi:hypothetical protein